MKTQQNNYAFIDSQNLHLGIKGLGWKLDLKKFRVYLKEKHGVKKAFLFMGYLENNTNFYDLITKFGYTIIFKPISYDPLGKIKGNIDADLVLHTLIRLNAYDKALIITSDGDFYSLVKYLYQIDKLKLVLNANFVHCSSLLKDSAKEKILYIDELKDKLELK